MVRWKVVHNRPGGLVLLMTLVVLVILASVIVQFQADTNLLVRASRYRQEKVQCTYAAESGMIIGSHLIQEVFKKPVTTSLAAEGAGEATKLNPYGDPNDPNAFSDPNDPNSGSMQLTAADPESPFLVYRKTIEVGEATVEIEIHDENAKWPMLWVLTSPFENDRDGKLTRENLKLLGDWLGADGEVMQEAAELTRELGKKIKIPTSDITVATTKSRSSDNKTTAKSSRSRRTVQKKRIGYQKRLAEWDSRYLAMGQFASQWQDAILHTAEYEVLKKEMRQEEPVLEYLGIWGNTKVNVNNASAEVLQAALEPVGITADVAQAIVEQRKTKPIGTITALNDLLPSDNQLREALGSLADVKSDTFSIHVTARLGRTHKTLIAGAFVDDRGRVKKTGTIPGE